MAEVVMRQRASTRALAEQLVVESAGVAADVGFDIDRRARKALELRGYGPVSHRAQQFEPRWLDELDLVVAMDNGHLRWLERHAPKGGYRAKIRLLLNHPLDENRVGSSLEIADPYFGDDQVFESCLDLIESGCARLLDELASELAP
jgi:low molecular weight protein-tyrosine phosphatase